ncbi:hypothetical protein BJY04DRAFT_233019 [Aspergillus karnatakaensis]|uniref:uncharacterized protein n=1 Tax=Aspergillus karnatakaensis TaxID=1810916 RepID=UPI003CCDF582
MTRCLCSARLLCLHRRSVLRFSSAAGRSTPPLSPRSGAKLQWTRQYSVGLERQIFDRKLFRDTVQLKPDKRLISRDKEKDLDTWLSLLRSYLEPETSKNGGTNSKSFIRSVDLAHLLYRARYELQMDPIAHLGLFSGDWAEAYNLITKLLDSAEALKEASLAQPGVVEDLASKSKLTLDQLTDKDSSPPQRSKGARISEMASLDALTSTPHLKNYYMLLMAEVWKVLGSIVVEAADLSPAESKQAMSCVYRILARLHHSGLVSERVYKYVAPENFQTTYRPPGMHLLSTHIMDILSDTVWQAHEAEIAAKAAAAGQDSPFLPVRVGIKELGHEVWLEFILWCCLEHGHLKEGISLVNQMKGRGSWHFHDWKRLLDNQESLRSVRIDRETSWYQSDSTNIPPERRKSTDPPLPFHGLGKKTISVEVVTCLLDNITNLVYTGKYSGGVRPHALLRHIRNLRFAISQAKSGSELLPTSKATNWLTLRVIEAGGLVPEADPRKFDDFLQATPYVVPPWGGDEITDEETLVQLRPSQIYDDTSAFAGLLEYNMRYYSYQRLCQGAMKSFAKLQNMTERSRAHYVNKCFSSEREGENEGLSFSDSYSTRALALSASANPHLSPVTIGHLFDLITVSRAFKFGRWLLYPEAGEPTVPGRIHGDQALAPSLWRFAAATDNQVLGESVLASLRPPISLNTFRALLNYRIRTHQWDLVVSTLRYIRDNRIKSWSHSNVATVAAEVIRLDHELEQQKYHAPTVPVDSELEINTLEAKQILYRLLVGEFDENRWRKARNPHFQLHTILGFTRLFRHIASPTLRELVESVFESKFVPTEGLPYIPSTAFHPIFAAVVETKGALAGERLYRRFCVSAESPELKHITEGGVSRFDERAELDYRKGNPRFDADYSDHLRKKMVFPNPNTVRILAHAAVQEPEPDSEPDSDSTVEEPYAFPFSTELEPVPISLRHGDLSDTTKKLDLRKNLRKTIAFCIERFEFFGLTSGDIVREVGQEIYAKYRETQEVIQEKKINTRKALMQGKNLGKTAEFRLQRWLAKEELKEAQIKERKRRMGW